jgi:hypothetical protein
MSITYTWVIKNLNQDRRGYADTLYLELSGTDGSRTKTANSTCCFGAEDYKPYSSWTKEAIDNFAEKYKTDLQNNIINQLNQGA